MLADLAALTQRLLRGESEQERSLFKRLALAGASFLMGVLATWSIADWGYQRAIQSARERAELAEAELARLKRVAGETAQAASTDSPAGSGLGDGIVRDITPTRKEQRKLLRLSREFPTQRVILTFQAATDPRFYYEISLDQAEGRVAIRPYDRYGNFVLVYDRDEFENLGAGKHTLFLHEVRRRDGVLEQIEPFAFVLELK